MEFRADVAIFGAGMTGLACSCFTSRDHLVFEKELVPGGACRTDEVSGFFFDFAEHFMRAPSSEILGFYETVAGDELVSQELRSGIWYRGRVVPYPFQKNIYYLDDEDKLRCLKGFFERQSAADECDPSFAGWFHRMCGKESPSCSRPRQPKLWCVSPDKLAADFSFDPNLIPPISTEEMLEYALLPIESGPRRAHSAGAHEEWRHRLLYQASCGWGRNRGMRKSASGSTWMSEWSDS